MTDLDTNIKDIKLEHKTFSFEVHEVKEETKGAQQFGVFFGSMATEDKDRGNDIIAPEAFDQSLKRYQKAGRNIRLFYQHDTFALPIGIIPIKSVEKDGKKWNIKGELNLDTQKGREVYSLLKQGALSDLSIGFSILDQDFKDNIRIIKELELWEVSVVSEPMNPKATISEVKGATTFHDLPLAPVDREWDADDAIARVRTETASEETASASYRNAFFWFDSANKENLTAYKLPFADVIDGKLTAVPRGVFAAAAAMSGARGGVDIPDADRQRVVNHINKYYKKMDRESPLKANDSEEDEKSLVKYEIDDVTNVATKKEFEDILRESGVFSRKAAVYLASRFQDEQSESSESKELIDLLSEAKSIVEKL